MFNVKMNVKFGAVVLVLSWISMETVYCQSCTSDAQCAGKTCYIPPGSTTGGCFDDCSPLFVPNGVINDTSRTFGTVVAVTCNPGYTNLGHSVLTCISGSIYPGNWNGIASCSVIASQRCMTPQLPNGTFNGSDPFYPIGTVLAVSSCEEGYDLAGDAIITCLPNGSWDGTPACEILNCELVTVCNYKLNIYVTTENGTYLSATLTITFAMMKNRVHNFNVNVKCDGPAVCNMTECGPLILLNGGYSSICTPYGTEVTAFCNPGYNLVGDVSRHCLANGTLSGNTTCVPVACRHSVHAHGSFHGTSTHCGSFHVRITLTGYKQTMCKAGCNWIGFAPCGLGVCGQLNLMNGQYNGTSPTYDIGTVLVGTCNEGYTHTGDTERTCLASGSWSGVAACNPIDCGALTLANGTFDSDDTMYGTVLTATCNQGFNLTGDTTRVCQANGTWSGQTACVAIPTCTCQTGWERYQDSCYLVKYNRLETFYDAKAYCKALGSDINLLQAETENENDFIKILIFNYPSYDGYRLYWVGAVYDGADVWHESQDLLTYDDFIGWNYGTMECAGYEGWWGWSRNSCDYLFTFICERMC